MIGMFLEMLWTINILSKGSLWWNGRSFNKTASWAENSRNSNPLSSATSTGSKLIAIFPIESLIINSAILIELKNTVLDKSWISILGSLEIFSGAEIAYRNSMGIKNDFIILAIE